MPIDFLGTNTQKHHILTVDIFNTYWFTHHNITE